MTTTTRTTNDNEKVATTKLMQNFATKFSNCSSFKVSTGGKRSKQGGLHPGSRECVCVCGQAGKLFRNRDLQQPQKE